MSELSYLEKLLDEAEVEWKNLSDVARIKNGKITSPLAKASSRFMVPVESCDMQTTTPIISPQS
jgi:hypothetical protein